jgi:ribonuclease HII
MILVGVDENGLGPRLGPLLVTAISARCTEDGAKIAQKKPSKAMGARLGDSKDLVSHGDSSLGEAWARVLHSRLTSTSAKSPDDLLHALCIDSSDALRARCPSDHLAQCWRADESFSAEEPILDAVSRDLDKLAAKGLEVSRVEISIICSERLNAAIDRKLSRFHVDLHTMERLVISARAAANENVVAVCGKVGGLNRYSDQFGPLAGRLHAVVEEGRARSEYQFPDLGRIAFVRDADASHLLVGMASLVGKWAREVLMARIVRHYREAIPSLPQASGYHDPVTTKFISATKLVRKQRNLPSECFERRALGPILSKQAADLRAGQRPAISKKQAREQATR